MVKSLCLWWWSQFSYARFICHLSCFFWKVLLPCFMLLFRCLIALFHASFEMSYCHGFSSCSSFLKCLDYSANYYAVLWIWLGSLWFVYNICHLPWLIQMSNIFHTMFCLYIIVVALAALSNPPPPSLLSFPLLSSLASEDDNVLAMTKWLSLFSSPFHFFFGVCSCSSDSPPL
jgi:hypothetical protein